MKEKIWIDVQMPYLIYTHNGNMGGVDLFDHQSLPIGQESVQNVCIPDS